MKHQDLELLLRAYNAFVEKRWMYVYPGEKTAVKRLIRARFLSRKLASPEMVELTLSGGYMVEKLVRTLRGGL